MIQPIIGSVRKATHLRYFGILLRLVLPTWEVKKGTQKGLDMALPNMQQIDPEAAVKQFKEFIGVYNKITQMCFTDCVHDFTTRKISKEENSCSLNCLEKYLKTTQRISTRFQEHHLQHTDDSPYKAMASKS